MIMIMTLITWSVASFEQSRCTSCCGACLTKHFNLLHLQIILGQGLIEVEGELWEKSSFQFSQPKIQVWLNPAWNIKCFSDCYNFTTQPDSTKSYFPNDLNVVWVTGLGLSTVQSNIRVSLLYLWLPWATCTCDPLSSEQHVPVTPLSKDEAKLSFLVSRAPTTSSHWPNSSDPLWGHKFAYDVFGFWNGVFGVRFGYLVFWAPTTSSHWPNSLLLSKWAHQYPIYALFYTKQILTLLVS